MFFISTTGKSVSAVSGHPASKLSVNLNVFCEILTTERCEMCPFHMPIHKFHVKHTGQNIMETYQIQQMSLGETAYLCRGV